MGINLSSRLANDGGGIRGLENGQDGANSPPPGDEFFAAVVQLSLTSAASGSGRAVSPTEVYVVVGDRASQLFSEATDRGLAGALATGETLDAAIGQALDQMVELDRLRAQALRTAVIERAKGVLMERQRLSERTAYERCVSTPARSICVSSTSPMPSSRLTCFLENEKPNGRSATLNRQRLADISRSRPKHKRERKDTYNVSELLESFIAQLPAEDLPTFVTLLDDLEVKTEARRVARERLHDFIGRRSKSVVQALLTLG